jgi:hypothetical protein
MNPTVNETDLIGIEQRLQAEVSAIHEALMHLDLTTGKLPPSHMRQTLFRSIQSMLEGANDYRKALPQVSVMRNYTALG